MKNNSLIDLTATNIKVFIDGKEVLVQSAKVLNTQETTIIIVDDYRKKIDVVNKSELVIIGTINESL
jgi:hypothetical protein